MQTCIMSSLPHCIFRCSVFRYVTLVSFFFVQTLSFNCNSFTLVANKYLLTYLLAASILMPTVALRVEPTSFLKGPFSAKCGKLAGLQVRDNVHSHLCHAKRPMAVSFLTPTPPHLKTAIPKWENFPKF